MTLLATMLASTGISADEVMNRLKSPSGLLLNLILGLGCTGVGGYAAARIAKRAEVLQGAMVAVAGIIIALVFREGDIPLWFEVLGLVAMLPAGMAGGHFARH